MDDLKKLYQNMIREEVKNPEVQNAKEAFLRKQFGAVQAGPSPWSWAVSPSFRFALVGCLALAVLVKINAFDPALQQPAPEPTLSESAQAVHESSAPAPSTVSNKPVISHASSIQIKKLTSQVGATLAYQKHFPDAQITVVWVLPKGV